MGVRYWGGGGEGNWIKKLFFFEFHFLVHYIKAEEKERKKRDKNPISDLNYFSANLGSGRVFTRLWREKTEK